MMRDQAEVVHAIDEDGIPYTYWFTSDKRDSDCVYCTSGKCIQKVVQYDSYDAVITIHNIIEDLD